MTARRFSHVVGIDDAPFERDCRDPVLLVGAVYARERLEGVLSAQIDRDGDNAAEVLGRMIGGSRFREHLDAVLLQGITMAGFNVVDIHQLSEQLDLPVLVVCRRCPDLPAIRSALLERVPGGAAKWQLIERAGEMEAMADVYVQRAGLSVEEAVGLLSDYRQHSLMPEPLRTAHLIAGGLATGESRHRV